jgi:N-glycosylase/DNA lyase
MSLATLRSLGFGYRADFIQKTAKMLVDVHGVSAKGDDGPEKWLHSLRSMSTADAREELVEADGRRAERRGLHPAYEPRQGQGM